MLSIGVPKPLWQLDVKNLSYQGDRSRIPLIAPNSHKEHQHDARQRTQELQQDWKHTY
jgi:hypothetical protein